MLTEVLRWFGSLSPWLAGLLILEAIWLLGEGVSRISLRQFRMLAENTKNIGKNVPDWEKIRVEVKEYSFEFGKTKSLSQESATRLSERVAEIEEFRQQVSSLSSLWKKRQALQERQFWLKVFHPKAYSMMMSATQNVDKSLMDAIVDQAKTEATLSILAVMGNAFRDKEIK